MNPEIFNSAQESFKKGIYQKNIHYIFERGAKADEFAMIKTLAGSPGMSAWMIQQAYYKTGVQLQVQKAVSDDLLFSDFSKVAKIEDIHWPAPVVEVFFEDYALPTILLMKYKPDDLQKLLPQIEIGLKSEEYITGLMQEGSDPINGKLLSLQLKSDMYNKFLQTGECEEMDTGPMSYPLSATDNCAMSFMLHLALKVFTFASIPVFKPVPIARKQMIYGGKSGIKDRPEKPSFRVQYLPKIITLKKKAEEKVRHIQFKGRRGHIRFFSSEKFVNKKGTWIFVEPLRNPLTKSYPEIKLVKVRKVI